MGCRNLVGPLLVSTLRSNNGRVVFLVVSISWILVGILGVSASTAAGLASALTISTKDNNYIAFSKEPCGGCENAFIYNCILKTVRGAINVIAVVSDARAIIYTGVGASTPQSLDNLVLLCDGEEARIIRSLILSPGIYEAELSASINHGKPLGRVWLRYVGKQEIYSQLLRGFIGDFVESLVSIAMPGFILASIFTGIAAFYTIRGSCSLLKISIEAGVGPASCRVAVVFASLLYASLIVSAGFSSAVLLSHIAIWVVSNLAASYAALPPGFPSLGYFSVGLALAACTAAIGGVVGGRSCCSGYTRY